MPGSTNCGRVTIRRCLIRCRIWNVTFLRVLIMRTISAANRESMFPAIRQEPAKILAALLTLRETALQPITRCSMSSRTVRRRFPAMHATASIMQKDSAKRTVYAFPAAAMIRKQKAKQSVPHSAAAQNNSLKRNKRAGNMQNVPVLFSILLSQSVIWNFFAVTASALEIAAPMKKQVSASTSPLMPTNARTNRNGL